MSLTLVRPFGLLRKRKCWRKSSHMEKKELPMKHKKQETERLGEQESRGRIWKRAFTPLLYSPRKDAGCGGNSLKRQGSRDGTLMTSNSKRLGGFSFVWLLKVVSQIVPGNKLRNSLNSSDKLVYNVLSRIETFSMRKQTNKQGVREKKLFSIFCLEATDVYHTSFGRTNIWLSAKQNFPW